MKRILSLVLVLAIVLSIVPTALASSEYYSSCSSHQESIVDALSEVGENDTSFSHRAEIAEANSINDYSGTAAQNCQLLELLKSGKLKRVVGTTNDDYSYSCGNYSDCSDGGTCYEIVDNDSPLRKKPNNKGKIIAKLDKGTIVKCVEIVENSYGNSWGKIEYTSKTGHICYGYIYEDHIMEHLLHTYVSALDTSYGSMDVCLLCGHTEISYSEGDQIKTVSYELLSIANQMVLGDYADDDTTLWGLIGRIAVGEIPVLGTAADIRDLVYDSTHCTNGSASCAALITMDAVALLPLAGILKTVSRSDDLIKNSNVIADTIKKYPWGTWSDYEKVVMDDRQYAVIGDHFYTYHAVSHFAPSGDRYGESLLEAYHYSQRRGISPTYVEYILGEGMLDGSTKVTYSAAKDHYYFVNGTVTVVTSSDKSKIITIIVDGK